MSYDTTTLDLQRQQLRLKKRQLAYVHARGSLLRYLELQMPDPVDLDDPDLTRMVATPQARLLCQIMEKVEAGKLKRVAVAIGPQLGKSQILSRGFPAWATGRNPYRNLMLGTYNQTFAEEFGGEVRDLIESPRHVAIFPEHKLQKGALDLLITDKGGKTAFVGVGGSGTGKPADFFVVDDPIRSDDDAQSQLYRDRIWKWFNAVVFTRCHSKSGIVVVHCLTGDTRITMADGTRKPLAEVRVGDDVASYEGGRLVARKILNFASQGEDDVFLVKTGSSAVRANARHPFAVMRNGEIVWIRTDHLRKGDVLLTTAVEPGDGERLSLDEAWLLGFMFGDGWLTRRDTTQWNVKTGRRHPRRGWVTCAAFSKEPEEDAKFETCFQRVFGFVPKRTRFGYWRTEVQRVGRWFAENGLLGKAKTKRIPNWLFAQNVEIRRAFIAGLHQADGTTDKKRQRSIALSNESMIRDVRDLARSVGLCVSNVHSWSASIQAPNSAGPVQSTILSFKWGVAECDEAFRSKPITVIEPAGRAEVFDIQVEGAENFIADGLVVHNTRWHTDDLIGRLCDPDHPERNKAYAGIADDWTYINLPAVVDDPALAADLGLTLEEPKDPRVVAQFGVKPISALWPERKGLDFLAEAKRMDPRTFNALYMGRPTAEDGAYFRSEYIVEYGPEDLPADLKFYGASDHAVSAKQENDPTVLGCVGVDENDDIWILPDLVWDRMQTDRTVEELLVQFKLHKPQLWWMESELISKSFGPFLHKRMIEERVYVTIDQVVPSKDKPTRARAIQGRMSMRKVHFPRFAPWFQDARRELLQFPYGAHDDFVDWLAHIGQGLLMARGAVRAPANENEAPVGSIQWILRSAKKRAAAEQRVAANRGW